MMSLILVSIYYLLLVKLSAATVVPGDDSGFVFTQELLQLTRTTAYLSNFAYSADPVSDAGQYYDSILVFNDEPDQALVVAVGGYCIAAFRGTVVSSWNDIYQNLETGNEQVCATLNDGVEACCNVERGFYNGYNTNYKAALEQALRTCAYSTCSTQTASDGTSTVVCPTVVLTGHSQGGSIAAAAALYLTDLSPIVITFGQPPTIDASCQLIDSNNYYRFVNSRVGNFGTTYDPVPYLPYQASQYGHQIMLGEDATGVAYIGKDAVVNFTPYDAENGFATHRLTPTDVGYIHRIESLAYANAGSPFIRSTGFQDGSVCSKDVECDSYHCSDERCVR